MKKFLFVIFTFIFFSCYCLASTTSSYDSYGARTGSFKQNGSTINQYDKYGSKVGSYKKTSSGYNSYNKYGSTLYSKATKKFL